MTVLSECSEIAQRLHDVLNPPTFSSIDEAEEWIRKTINSDEGYVWHSNVAEALFRIQRGKN